MIEEEIFPLVDELGNAIGQAARSKCHDGSKLLHPVIHLHIFNSKGELFLQKRSSTKDIQPNLWDTASAGHIDVGESPEEAVMREVKEELGITDILPQFIRSYIIETDVERELSYCFYAVYDGQITIDRDEVADGRFWSIEEIWSQLGKGIFTLNFESDFSKFLSEGISAINQIQWKANKYSDLDKDSLYRILDIRNRVFMLEQKVECPDLDYRDQYAVHLQGFLNGELIAYCRIFFPTDNTTEASIGRVAVSKEYRKKGYGRLLTEKALEIIGNIPVKISAQQYLEDFYRDLGFTSYGEPYMEAGIPHIKMKK
jgi:predicted GNAT family N-acyltransferase/isopentenyldiphosphate isomerase